ncbi:MAG: hypothetical protein HYZ53_27735 [Planctomycetes bacterium]|nr:hypothetical protein [Planctomycetota bacterium]
MGRLSRATLLLLALAVCITGCHAARRAAARAADRSTAPAPSAESRPKPEPTGSRIRARVELVQVPYDFFEDIEHEIRGMTRSVPIGQRVQATNFFEHQVEDIREKLRRGPEARILSVSEVDWDIGQWLSLRFDCAEPAGASSPPVLTFGRPDAAVAGSPPGGLLVGLRPTLSADRMYANLELDLTAWVEAEQGPGVAAAAVAPPTGLDELRSGEFQSLPALMSEHSEGLIRTTPEYTVFIAGLGELVKPSNHRQGPPFFFRRRVDRKSLWIMLLIHLSYQDRYSDANPQR